MRIIRLKEVIDSTGLARSTIYKYIGEGTFPKPVSLGNVASPGSKARYTTGSWQGSRSAIRPRSPQADLAAW